MRMRKSDNGAVRRIDPSKHWEDHWCQILLMKGRSNWAIRKQTGKTDGQIAYMIKWAMEHYGVSIKRSDYRNGTSGFAKQMDKATDGLAEEVLKKYITKHLGKK